MQPDRPKYEQFKYLTVMRKTFFSLSILLSLLLFSSAVCAQTDLTGATVTLTPTGYDYDGTECKPKVSGIRKGTKRYNSLVEGVDYDLSYTDNVNAGEATATLTFKGDYTGVATKTFTISPKDLSREESVVLVLSVTEVVYDGTEQTPSASDMYYDEKLLVSGTDYDITYKNNTNPGVATVTATFKGNYGGTKTATFTIIDGGLVPPSSLTVNYYDSSEATPQVEKDMTYDEFKTLMESFPNAIAIAPQGFDVWPLDKKHIVVKGEGIGNNMCNSFTLTDKKDFYSSVSFTAKSFSYTRDLVAGYNTFCLPFAVGNADIPDGAHLYYFNFAEEGINQLFFRLIQSGDAGYPFLMKTEQAESWNVSLSNVRIEPTITNNSEGNEGFFGTYTLTSEYKYSDSNPFMGVRNSDNKFAPLANTLSPFRACVKVREVNDSEARSGYSIVLGDDILTGVKNVESQIPTSQFNGKIFKDGRIIFLKNGTMFNAAGAQIK